MMTTRERMTAAPMRELEHRPHGPVDESAVGLRGLTKSFGAVQAVDHLSLEIGRGETVALLAAYFSSKAARGR